MRHKKSGLSFIINQVQTIFVAMLRLWNIPVVLLLSVASGFTTYYGMSHFITPWIALVITIAIQSIVVICSLEIANIRWRANKLKYFSIAGSLLIALAASISFSYFKFYQISQTDTIHINRLNQVRQQIEDYINKIMQVKAQIFEQQRLELENAAQGVSQAYFGTHKQIPADHKNLIGEGPFWKRYNQLYLEKKAKNEHLESIFTTLDTEISKLQVGLNQLDVESDTIEPAYQQLLTGLQGVQINFNKLAVQVKHNIPQAPVLMTYSQFVQGITPALTMWVSFSLFAFICAAMVDFFTVLLSYRLEFTTHGVLSEQEEELVFQCIKQFNQFRINSNDELEIIITKTEIEKARNYSDWSRMFAVGFLLSRGFLRKIDNRTVGFAPNLYPLIADRLSAKLPNKPNLELGE